MYVNKVSLLIAVGNSSEEALSVLACASHLPFLKLFLEKFPFYFVFSLISVTFANA